jgi:hypothetical protein
LAEVGIESALAGWARTLFSDASAAAVYWSSIMPDSRPLPDERNGGRPPLRRASTISAIRRSEMAPSSEMASLAKSRARHGLAVEVAAADHQPAARGRGRGVGHAALRKDERVVRGRVQLHVQHAAQVVERVAAGAVDLGHAAERVRVLDLVAEAWWLVMSVESRSSQRSSAATAIWPGCGRASW